MNGGGIHNESSLVIINSTIAKNTVPDGSSGAGMSNATGLDSVLVFNSIFYKNSSPNDANFTTDNGIHNSNGKLVLFNNYLDEQQASLTISRSANNIFSNTNPFTGSNSDNYTISSQALLESGANSVVYNGATYNAIKDLKGNIDLALRILI